MSKKVNIGYTIQDLRAKRGITQERLAELSNLSVNFISKIERENSQNISIKNLVSIADSLGVSLNNIIETSAEVENKNSYNAYLLYKKLTSLPPTISEDFSKDFLNIIEKYINKKDV